MKKKFPLLEIGISPLTYKKALSFITKLVEQRKKSYICVCAVHLIMECQTNWQLKKIVNNAELVTADGMPVVWWLKWSGLPNVERVYGPDLTLKVCHLAEEKGWRLVFLGGAAGQSYSLKAEIKRRYPKLKFWILDTPQKLQTDTEKKKALALVNQKKPEIIFVGIGCPLQELWMGEAVRVLKTDSVLIGVGAAFDFISGKVKQAPPFMQQLGLEWLFRLTQDPKRLWKRYLILNTLFIFKLCKRWFIQFF